MKKNDPYLLSQLLEDKACINLYYSFTSKYIKNRDSNHEVKLEVGQIHVHTFLEVLGYLYDYPESFKILSSSEYLYSKQELQYLRRIQKYLLLMGFKDLEISSKLQEKERNEKLQKCKNIPIYELDDEIIERIKSGQQNFCFSEWYEEYRESDFKETNAFIVDKENNFKIFVEFTKEEVKDYKDIKESCFSKNLKDSDKVIVKYFKILEILK